MGYSTPIQFFKYLRYYWVASNSKGHGIHSPFVFKLIQEQFNVSKSLEVPESFTPAMQQLVQELQLASANQLPKKIIQLMGRLLLKFNPTVYCIIKEYINQNNLSNIETLDFAFLTATDQVEAFLSNANKALQMMHPAAWMMVQGIHSSEAMETAWEKLKTNKQVRLTIDLFSIGILFCRKEQKEKEHFIIRY
ncbi:MAG: hypothetical protein RL188_778 [Bacteroidota bacterium]|jgi:hypothetical protein